MIVPLIMLSLFRRTIGIIGRQKRKKLYFETGKSSVLKEHDLCDPDIREAIESCSPQGFRNVKIRYDRERALKSILD